MPLTDSSKGALTYRTIQFSMSNRVLPPEKFALNACHAIASKPLLNRFRPDIFRRSFPNLGDKKPESRFISLTIGLSDLRYLRDQFCLRHTDCQQFVIHCFRRKERHQNILPKKLRKSFFYFFRTFFQNGDFIGVFS